MFPFRPIAALAWPSSSQVMTLVMIYLVCTPSPCVRGGRSARKGPCIAVCRFAVQCSCCCSRPLHSVLCFPICYSVTYWLSYLASYSLPACLVPYSQVSSTTLLGKKRSYVCVLLANKVTTKHKF